MLYGITGNTRIRSLRLRYPLPVRNVQTEDQRRFSGGSAGYWLKNGYPFELRRPEYSYKVKFGGYVRAEVTEEGKTRFIQENYQSVLAVPYDMPIVGYGNHVVDTLIDLGCRADGVL